jgi:hypothetical protein
VVQDGGLETGGLEIAAADETSLSYLGRWQQLVSTTNWEKGRIIFEWRQALEAAGADWQQFSDEAWSRRVGNVTGQHVGRLRRVFERFGAARETYPGLYWSHFQAAIDWDDAEMWLEGAIQNAWSISEMRQERWQAFGGAAEQPSDAESSDAELDEDFTAENLSEIRDPAESSGRAFDADRSVDDDESTEEPGEGSAFDPDAPWDESGASAAVRPFEELPELPADVSEAFEAYKLAILRHKVAGWHEVSLSQLLASLEALKQLALAPPSG